MGIRIDYYELSEVLALHADKGEIATIIEKGEPKDAFIISASDLPERARSELAKHRPLIVEDPDCDYVIVILQ